MEAAKDTGRVGSNGIPERSSEPVHSWALFARSLLCLFVHVWPPMVEGMRLPKRVAVVGHQPEEATAAPDVDWPRSQEGESESPRLPNECGPRMNHGEPLLSMWLRGPTAALLRFPSQTGWQAQGKEGMEMVSRGKRVPRSVHPAESSTEGCPLCR